MHFKLGKNEFFFCRIFLKDELNDCKLALTQTELEENKTYKLKLITITMSNHI